MSWKQQLSIADQEKPAQAKRNVEYYNHDNTTKKGTHVDSRLQTKLCSTSSYHRGSSKSGRQQVCRLLFDGSLSRSFVHTQKRIIPDTATKVKTSYRTNQHDSKPKFYFHYGPIFPTSHGSSSPDKSISPIPPCSERISADSI